MRRGLFLPLLLFFAVPLWAQETANAGANADVQLSFVGMRLAELVERFGSPKAVFAVRGNEIWQDDVVFQYAEGDFYIFKDRVWQVKLASARGISLGDPRAAALLVLGGTAEDRGDHLLLTLAEKNWPLMFRVNFNNAGLVSALYIYRSDY
jgi:hypothetical protein